MPKTDSQKRSENLRKRDNGRRKKFCEECGAKETLHLHHVALGISRDVVTLCYACHWRLHEWPIPAGIPFPKGLPKDLFFRKEVPHCERWTHIELRKETLDELKSLRKYPGQPFDIVIYRLIDGEKNEKQK